MPFAADTPMSALGKLVTNGRLGQAHKPQAQPTTQAGVYLIIGKSSKAGMSVGLRGADISLSGQECFVLFKSEMSICPPRWFSDA